MKMVLFYWCFVHGSVSKGRCRRSRTVDFTVAPGPSMNPSWAGRLLRRENTSSVVIWLVEYSSDSTKLSGVRLRIGVSHQIAEYSSSSAMEYLLAVVKALEVLPTQNKVEGIRCRMCRKCSSNSVALDVTYRLVEKTRTYFGACLRAEIPRICQCFSLSSTKASNSLFRGQALVDVTTGFLLVIAMSLVLKR